MHHLEQALRRLCALRGKAWPRSDAHIILPALEVNRASVDRYDSGFLLFAQHPDLAFRVVDLRDQLNQNAPGFLNGGQKIVDEGKGADIGLLLTRQNGSARGLIAASAKARVINARRRLQVVRCKGRLLQHRPFNAGGFHALRRAACLRVRCIREIWRIARGHAVPFFLPALNLPIGHKERGFRRKRQLLNGSRAPVIDHALTVFGVTDDGRTDDARPDLHFLAPDGYNRDAVTCPLVRS